MIGFSPYSPPSFWKAELENRVKSRGWESERRTSALVDPMFGWRYIKSLVYARQPLPITVTEPTLWRAYRYETSKHQDSTIFDAITLQHPKMCFSRNVVKACLLIPDMPCEEIARHVSIEPEAIEAYAQLFWNVRDRMDEKFYIPSLVYPQGRVAQMTRAIDMANLDSGQFLLQAAFELGRDALFYWAGFKTETGEKLSNDQAARELRQAILRNANVLAQLGLLNQDLPAIKDAIRLLRNSKSRLADPPQVKDGISVSYSITSTIERICRANAPCSLPAIHRTDEGTILTKAAACV